MIRTFSPSHPINPIHPDALSALAWSKEHFASKGKTPVALAIVNGVCSFEFFDLSRHQHIVGELGLRFNGNDANRDKRIAQANFSVTIPCNSPEFFWPTV